MKKLSELSIITDDTKTTVAKKITLLNPKLDSAPKAFVTEMIQQMQAREKRPLKNRLIAEIENGTIIPVFSLSAYGNGMIFLPVWAARNGSNIVGVANLTNRFKVDRKGEIAANPKQFYNLCAAALIFKELTMNPELFTRNAKLVTALSRIYSKMMVKVVDKLYGVSYNELVLDQIRYIFAKFFVVGCIGKNDAAASLIALKSVKTSSRQAVMDIDRMIPIENYQSFKPLLETLSGIFNNLSKISVHSVVAETVKSYGATSFLVVEFAPMLLINVMFAIWDSGINISYAYNSVIDKDGEDVLTEINNIVK
jgi:hypothetical protein